MDDDGEALRRDEKLLAAGMILATGGFLGCLVPGFLIPASIVGAGGGAMTAVGAVLRSRREAPARAFEAELEEVTREATRLEGEPKELLFALTRDPSFAVRAGALRVMARGARAMQADQRSLLAVRLQEMGRDPSVVVRIGVAWGTAAMAEFLAPADAEAIGDGMLDDAQLAETPPEFRKVAVYAVACVMKHVPGPVQKRWVTRVARYRRDSDFITKLHALECLGNPVDQEALEAAMEVLQPLTVDAEGRYDGYEVLALASIGAKIKGPQHEEVLDFLIARSSSSDASIRGEAILELWAFGEASAEPGRLTAVGVLVELIDDSDSDNVASAKNALHQLRPLLPRDALKLVDDALGDYKPPPPADDEDDE